ncbi:unnamed protein product [Caenorhabditis angaria]|uniref:Serine/threonine-protein kinase RIO3 n=1 Tax=Caenorhabditis angaria TaxID=860376 RepID=A0A9P1IJL6_9PELO|nr:unnamed protein product [Caenorhabditis angaria]
MEGEKGVEKKFAWGKTQNEAEEPIVSFAELMSEELAESLSKEDADEEEKYLKQLEFVLNSTAMDEVLLNTDGMTDEEVAIALQRQFDREDDVARAVQSTDTVHFTPERYHPKTAQESESDEEDLDELREIATDMLYAQLDAENARNSTRLHADGASSSTTTKHDIGVSGRRNADKTLNDRMNLTTGDMISGKINNRVYNSLLAFGKSDAKRQMRMKDKEEKATMDTSVDANTRLTLLKWINQGVIDSIEGIIATGKESAVLHAKQNENNEHYAVKVYKTTLSEFKNRSEYVKDDFRFKNPRGVLKIWAEREFMNLSRMTKHGLPCPCPFKLKKNMLAMSLIGNGGIAAPRLKNVQWEFFTDEERRGIYEQVEKIMCRMYKECLLVHGDLSEFNLLLNLENNQVFVIDVSQAMDLSHPRNLQFLTRDIANILAFFARIETPGLPSSVQLFNLITDLEMKEDDDLNVQVEQFSEENRAVHLRHDKSRPADLELSRYQEDKKANRGISPARDYN